MLLQPCVENAFLAEHCDLLAGSYLRWTGRDLVEPLSSGLERARAIFEAPFALVSHGRVDDPVFNYGNRTALALFEVNWETFMQMPSRESAEAIHRDERARLFDVVNSRGYTDEYAGIRVSANGRRFAISQASVWIVAGDQGVRHGHAAMFSEWKYL